MGKFKVISDGTPKGTSVIGPDGEKITSVTEVAIRLTPEGVRVAIEILQVPIDIQIDKKHVKVHKIAPQQGVKK